MKKIANHMNCKNNNQIVLEENALVYMISITKASMLTLSFKLGSTGSWNALHYEETHFCDHLGSVTMLGDYSSF